MKFFHRSCRSVWVALAAASLCIGTAMAQNYSSMGTRELVNAAEHRLGRGDYAGAIPCLIEAVQRTSFLSSAAGKEAAQNCRFKLATAYYKTGKVPEGMKILNDYLGNEPRPQERMALRMVAQGHFDTDSWVKIEEIATRLLGLSDLDRDDIFTANLLLGQALFYQEKWDAAIEPLSFVAGKSSDDRIKGMSQVMLVRSLVQAEKWSELFGWIPRIYRTDSKYDITVNLTLMQAGKSLFDAADEEEDLEKKKRNYLNAMLLYRMVLPRDELLEFSGKRIDVLSAKLEKDVARGIPEAEVMERKNEIKDIRASMKVLKDLAPYEDEVTFRIGQIYAEVKRYWEAYVLFDKLYQTNPDSDIGSAAALQSTLVLFDVNEADRAEERVLRYLRNDLAGPYSRTLMAVMMRYNLQHENLDQVIVLAPYLAELPAATEADAKDLQADLHYMLAFAYFQRMEYKASAEQFGMITDNYKGSTRESDSVYYRAMSNMLEAEYADALEGFRAYQKYYQYGEHVPSSLFREGVCLYGMEKIPEAEVVFTRFIETYPNDPLVAEAYAMRGDIEGAKPATLDDPYTLERALSDYRMAIDKATSSLQASYAAFQAAKVFKLESNWQEIIDLMTYYMDRWEEKANIAEAVYWIGQAQIELGQLEDAVNSYMEAIERFGNDPVQQGVDNIIEGLVKVSKFLLSEEDREGLAVRIRLKLTSISERRKVLRLRLQVLQTMLQGDDIAAAFGAELLEDKTDLKITSPISLSLMCDAAVDVGDAEAMERLADYFIENYEESRLLWHAYRSLTFKWLAQEEYKEALWTIDEAQGLFGVEYFMGWAQMTKADTEYTLKKYEDAEKSYNMVMGVTEWRGPLFAEAMYGMGRCRQASGDLEGAHSFYQRTYLLFKSYDDGNWAAKGYLSAADVLIKLGRKEDAVRTLKAMLEDEYTNTNPLAAPVREQLRKLGE